MSIFQPEPCPPPSGAGSGSVAEFILCDAGNGSQRFIRKFIQNSTGTVTSVVDLDLEGAAYVPVGPVTSCSTTTAAEVEVINDPLNPVPITGTVNVGNFPASVEVSNDAGNPLPVSGTVAISNFPVAPASTEITNDVGNPIPVSGIVTLDAATLAALETINAIVSGTVALDAATLAALETINAVVSGTVAVSNFPASVEVSNDVGNPLPVSGTVAISNFPAAPASTEISNDVGNPIPVSGTVAVTDDRTLTERMFARAPVAGYSMWFDTADTSYIYSLEAPSGVAAGSTGFRGIRTPKDALGNPVGKVQINTAGTLTFTNRTTDAGWA